MEAPWSRHDTRLLQLLGRVETVRNNDTGSHVVDKSRVRTIPTVYARKLVSRIKDGFEDVDHPSVCRTVGRY